MIRPPSLWQFVAVAGLLWCWTPTAVAQPPELRIGVSLDGPWERNEEALETFTREVTDLVGAEFAVSFPEAKRLTGDWTSEQIKANLDVLVSDEEVDLVLALGVLGSNEAVRRGGSPKPLIAPFVLFPELQGAPYEERTADGLMGVQHVSGADNLSYTVVGADFEREIRQFLEITPFRRMTVLTMQALRDAIPEIGGQVAEAGARLGVEVDTVAVAGSVEDALAAIPSDSEAVYVTPLLQLPAGGLQRVAQGLIERRLPSFSLWGRREVELGLMAGLALERDFNRTARRTALNIHRIVLGEPASEIPVDFEQEERLSLNMRTARAVGIYRTWEILTEAELIDPDREEIDRQLSLDQVVREASVANLDLAAADRVVAAGLQRIREARSALLPQVTISGLETVIDRDRAEASFGSMGQSQTSGALGLTQLIFSENARAGRDIETALQASREQERAELLLDVILEAAQAYLNVLRTKTIERIQRENLELTRQNLERARSRVGLGVASPGELFRWQTQLANNRKDFIASTAQRNQSELNVNRILNRPIEEAFGTAETDLLDPFLAVNYEPLRPYIGNQEGFRIYRTFIAEEAFRASPELKQLDATIEAQERQLLAARRAFYLPTVAAQAEITTFKNAGPGSSSPFEGDAEIPGLELATPNSLNWNLGFSASLPLFAGGQLRAVRSRAQIELDELTVRREAVRRRVEQRSHAALHQAMASWAAIDLSREAASAAGQNLDLVADAYSEGTVDILRLLDAQNQALVAELVAASAVYDFMIDLMSVQRSVGGFDYFRSDAEKDEFLRRMRTYFEERGYRVRGQQ